MKLKLALILVIILPQNLFSQSKIDSVAIMLKMNYVLNYSKIEFEDHNTNSQSYRGFIDSYSLYDGIDEELGYLLSPDFKVKYMFDTIHSDYFKEYDLIKFYNYGRVFTNTKNNGTYTISSIDGPKSEFLIAIPKNGDLTNIKFISGYVSLSELGFLNDEFHNDTNFTEEIFKLRMSCDFTDYYNLKKIKKNLEFEIFEFEYINPRLSKTNYSKSKIYFDLKTLCISKIEIDK